MTWNISTSKASRSHVGLRNHIEQEEEVSCPIFHSLLLPAKHSVVEILGCGNIRLLKNHWDVFGEGSAIAAK